MKASELGRYLQVEVTLVETWVEHGWLAPQPEPDGAGFSEADLARGRLILDLTRSMGLNEAGVDVAMDLLDQVHGLRLTLRGLLDAMDRRPGGRRHLLRSDIVDID